MIELLVVVVITGLLATALAGALVAVVRNDVSTSKRLDRSRDLLHLATWLSRFARASKGA